jgi:septum formation protein
MPLPKDLEVDMKLILASASPRRYEILKKHGIEPLVLPADVDEILTPEIEALGPERSAIYLAHLKSWAIYERISGSDISLAPHFKTQAIFERINSPDVSLKVSPQEDSLLDDPQPLPQTAHPSIDDDQPPVWILAADTIVYFEGRMIGKPKNAEDAFATLSSLRGAENKVLTGVSLIDLRDGQETQFCDTTTIRFKDYPDSEIERYIREEAPFDKSGAYSIQSSWIRNVAQIFGDPENAIGLPWYRIAPLLSYGSNI